MKLLILYLLLITKTFAFINLHCNETEYINYKKHQKTYQKSLLITNASTESKRFFITCSFGKQETFNNKNYQMEIHKNEKKIDDKLDINLVREAKNDRHYLNYQIHLANQPLTIIKTKLLAHSELDVIAGITQKNESKNVDIFYDISIQSPLPLPGIYTDIFTLFLYEGNILNKDSASLIESKELKLVIHVPNITKITVPNQLISDNVTIIFESNSESHVMATQKINNQIELLPIKNKKNFLLINPKSDLAPITITATDN